MVKEGVPKNGAGTSAAASTSAAAGPSNSSEPYASPYMRQPKKFSFWRGIYNPDKNYILGRTPRNWGSLLIFYAIFYVILAALFAICMQGLFATLSDTEPKWKLHESRIGSSPGLGFRPISEKTNEGSMIFYEAKKKDHVDRWAGLLNKFLDPYTESQKPGSRKGNLVACDAKTPPKAHQVCAFDISALGNCSAEHGYGYNKSAPCVFLKLNKIYNWQPEFYDDVVNLPEEMPNTLKLHIATLPAEQRKQIWVSCRGENSADNEAVGQISYYPQPGFPGYYYPYTNSPGYLSPLVAVQFQRPEKHRIVNVECRAWAKNIVYNGSYRDRQGSVHFEMMID